MVIVCRSIDPQLFNYIYLCNIKSRALFLFNLDMSLVVCVSLDTPYTTMCVCIYIFLGITPLYVIVVCHHKCFRGAGGFFVLHLLYFVSLSIHLFNYLCFRSECIDVYIYIFIEAINFTYMMCAFSGTHGI